MTLRELLVVEGTTEPLYEIGTTVVPGLSILYFPKCGRRYKTSTSLPTDHALMNFVSTILDTLQALPDPLIYTFIAVTASGAVYSTIHHVKHWRLRKQNPPKLSGSAARRIEDCTFPCPATR